MTASPLNPLTGGMPATRLIAALLHRMGTDQVTLDADDLNAARSYDLRCDRAGERYRLRLVPKGLVLPR